MLLTAWIGRAVLAGLTSGIVNDVGDPLLNAAILGWNAQSMPWTDAWYDFPIFYPTSGALTFSEHLLGLAPLATPLYWLTGSVLSTYNLVLLLTFPLCAITMYLFVRRLTGSSGAAFVSGIAFAFAPYRVAQLSHIQVLGVFWMPLAMLGLHEYVTSRRRRWLALFAVAFALQGATNGYYLVFLTVFVAAWALWFVVRQRLWRQLAALVVAGIVALVPLVPILYRYVATHRAHGFERSLTEVRGFSADVAGLLCAPQTLSVWGTVQIGCKAEGELFPGVALMMLCVVAAFVLRPGLPRPQLRRGRALSTVRWLLLGIATAYVVITAAVWWFGPWHLEVGPLSASASSIRKPLSVAVLCALGLGAMSDTARDAARRSSTAGFYALAAMAMWMLALGPEPAFLGRPLLYAAPYLWLMQLPGIEGLRVPSRSWMFTVFCLAVLVGLVTAEILRRRGRAATLAIVTILATALLIDGWTTMHMAVVRRTIPDRALLRGGVVLELPSGDLGDDASATFDAVEGGWRTVNGYSGYEPSYYPLLAASSTAADGRILDVMQARGPLHVVVRTDHPALLQMVDARPDAVPTSETAEAVQYDLRGRLPPRDPLPLGPRFVVSHTTVSCGSAAGGAVRDVPFSTSPVCSSPSDVQDITLDLARPVLVGAVVQALERYHGGLPRDLIIETSTNGAMWDRAWRDGLLAPAFDAAMQDLRTMRLVFRFSPREARFVRLRIVGDKTGVRWSTVGIEVRGAP